jgi:hypothetical protein
MNADTTTVDAAPPRQAPVVTPDHPDRSHALDDLRRRVAGTVHAPGDADWDAARAAWNVIVDQHPLAVVDVRDAADVRAAVRWAVDLGFQVTAQPTGHAAVHGLGSDVVLLRTGALRDIVVDEHRRTVSVGAGVKVGDLLEALDGSGLTFLAGSNGDPTVVGMTLTGGISWFGRAYGLGSDSIVAVDLVDGLGRERTLTAASHGHDAELFWAVRGGGGDFGVVTRMEVALHPAPELYGGRLLWPLDRLPELLRVFAEQTAAAPEALSTWLHAYQFPPIPDVPEPLRGRAFASIAVAYVGAAEECELLLAPYRAVPGLELDLMGVVPLAELGGIAAEPSDPTPGMEWSRLLERLDEDTMAAIVRCVGEGSGSPLPVVQVRHLGGAFARTSDGAGAHGPVHEPYNLFLLGIPAVPELVPLIEGSFARVGAEIGDAASGRVLLNFSGARAHADWWTEQDRDRLVRAKVEADPLGTIRSNRPVRVAEQS